MTTEEKFIEKNKAIIEKLNEFIATNRNDIAKFTTSLDLGVYLSKTPLAHDLRWNESELRFKYSNIKVITDPYAPPQVLYPIMKNNKFIFDLPCLCGYFNDELHP